MKWSEKPHLPKRRGWKRGKVKGQEKREAEVQESEAEVQRREAEVQGERGERGREGKVEEGEERGGEMERKGMHGHEEGGACM